MMDALEKARREKNDALEYATRLEYEVKSLESQLATWKEQATIYKDKAGILDTDNRNLRARLVVLLKRLEEMGGTIVSNDVEGRGHPL